MHHLLDPLAFKVERDLAILAGWGCPWTNGLLIDEIARAWKTLGALKGIGLGLCLRKHQFIITGSTLGLLCGSGLCFGRSDIAIDVFGQG